MRRISHSKFETKLQILFKSIKVCFQDMTRILGFLIQKFCTGNIGCLICAGILSDKTTDPEFYPFVLITRAFVRRLRKHPSNWACTHACVTQRKDATKGLRFLCLTSIQKDKETRSGNGYPLLSLQQRRRGNHIGLCADQEFDDFPGKCEFSWMWKVNWRSTQNLKWMFTLLEYFSIRKRGIICFSMLIQGLPKHCGHSTGSRSCFTSL